MTRTRLVVVVASQLAAYQPLSAQERYSRLESVIDKTGDFLISLFERPVRPDFATVAPGGGIGTGLTFSPRCVGPWCVDASAVATVRSYWGARGALTYSARTTSVTTYGDVREMPKLDFFGLGGDSDESNRTNFRLSARVVGVQVDQRITGWVTLTARAEQFWPDVGRGRSSDVPSIENLFDNADAPGLTRQPSFGQYEAEVRVDLPAGGSQAMNQGGEYRASYARYSDQDQDRYSFGRLDVEFRQRFAVLGALRRLTLHGLLTSTSTGSGDVVPFYLMPTLGGHDLVLGRGEPIGSDGTRATLRGFTNYRFRDRHLLLLQAEYRVPIWGPIDLSFFGDAGNVTSTRGDLDLTDLRRDVGVSLSIMRGPNTAARLDVGFGGGEGARMLLTVGRVIAP